MGKQIWNPKSIPFKASRSKLEAHRKTIELMYARNWSCSDIAKEVEAKTGIKASKHAVWRLLQKRGQTGTTRKARVNKDTTQEGKGTEQNHGKSDEWKPVVVKPRKPQPTTEKPKKPKFTIGDDIIQ